MGKNAVIIGALVVAGVAAIDAIVYYIAKKHMKPKVPPAPGPGPAPAPTPTPTPTPKEQKPEVFAVGGSHGKEDCWHVGDAVGIAAMYNGTVANDDQMTEAQKDGASWCANGWVSHKNPTTGAYEVTRVGMPLDADTSRACGGTSGAGMYFAEFDPSRIGELAEYVAVYAVKPKTPASSDHKLISWNSKKYSKWD